MKVYLCGGMRGGWQDAVIALLPGHTFLDPRKHGLCDAKEYTEWDFAAIKQADVVLACMTADNPSGYGLNLEIGYAFGIGVPVCFVSEDLGARDHYFGMARSCSKVFPSLESACVYLRDTVED